MGNINFFDPHNVIISKFSDLGIPNFEEIRSFAEMSMRPKIRGYVEIDTSTNTYTFKRTSTSGKITLMGFKTVNGEGVYTTDYTDELMGNNGRNQDYEGFGIKSIDVTFDANKIPQVTVVFYDLRGNVLNNFDSKFANMFQLPYPIFNLKLKGGFGPAITYRLLKTRDDISIDEYGNFIITSKFVGDKFAPLADIPLLYLMAVPYLDGKDVTVTDAEITSFHELIINVKRLYEKAGQETNSQQQQANAKKLELLVQKHDQLKAIYDSLNLTGEETIRQWFLNDSEYNSQAQPIKDNFETNYLQTTTINRPEELSFGPPTLLAGVTLPTPIFLRIYDSKVTLLNDNIKAIEPGSPTLIFQGWRNRAAVNDKYEYLDFRLLGDKIRVLKADIINQAAKNNLSTTRRVTSLIPKYLGATRLTISNIFKFIIQDYNILMQKIYNVAQEAIAGPARNDTNIRDRIAFPTVVKVKNGVETIVYPGVFSKFSTWPEVKFVDDFINAYFKAVRNNYIANILYEKNSNGSDKYIPINPREVYVGINSINSTTNPYFNKNNPDDLFALVFDRFRIFGFIDCNITNKNTPAGVSTVQSWNSGIDDTGIFTDIANFFTSTSDINDDNIQKSLFLTYNNFEARNIAYAILTNDTLKKWFKLNQPLFSSNPTASFFTSNPTSPLSKSRSRSTNNRNAFYDDTSSIEVYDINYLTVSDVIPTEISNTSSSDDMITEYIKSLDNITSDYTFTDANILYKKDVKQEANPTQSDFDNPAESVKQIYDRTNRIDYIYWKTNSRVESVFQLDKLFNLIKLNSVVGIPKGILVIYGGILEYVEGKNPSQLYYELEGDLIVYRNSEFYKYIKNIWYEFKNKYSYYLLIESTGFILQKDLTVITPTPDIVDYLYEPVALSINDWRTSRSNFAPGITPNPPNRPTSYSNYNTINDNIYAHWLNLLLRKVNELVVKYEKEVDDKLNAFKGSINDPDVKLSVYKSFQTIYENYIYSEETNNFLLSFANDFKFVDRAYNPIGDICVLDLKTLVSDTNDPEVSVLTAISRLLSDNNFWFYPFQGFLTTSENYKDLFAIQYDVDKPVEPLFVAMYVGGLSSNPVASINSPITDDGIKENTVPDDFGKTGSLNGFIVKYTGIQNQTIFSNFEHSTESLKNTDEGLRIQSEIINNASNTFAIPKGQSLLNVYQKQSYSSTIKIPFGNMGIQPTQYYLEKFIPIFEGLYIIYNVQHSIDADTQRLETTFKGYRLKKDVNPIIEQELVDFIKSNVYTNILNTIGGGVDQDSNPLSQTESDRFYNELLDYLTIPRTTKALNLLRAWRTAKGDDARFNPFSIPNVHNSKETRYNNLGVWNFGDFDRGVQATGDYLLATYDATGTRLLFGNILKALKDAASSTQSDIDYIYDKALDLQKINGDFAIYEGAGPSGLSNSEYVVNVLQPYKTSGSLGSFVGKPVAGN